MGKHWQQILWTYQFHPSRRAVDLKDKYKQLQVDTFLVLRSKAIPLRTQQKRGEQVEVLNSSQYAGLKL